MMRYCNGKGLAGLAILPAIVLAIVAMSPVVARANPIVAWWFDDEAPPGWGSGTPYWERMDYLTGPGTSWPLDPDHPFYGCTEPMTEDWSNWLMGTVIWFSNSHASQNRVVVQLRKGSWGNEGALVAEDTVTVTRMAPGAAAYYSVFNSISSLVLNNESLIVKIVYLGAAGDTYIYWNDTHVWPPSYLWTGGTNSVRTSTWGRIKALYTR